MLPANYSQTRIKTPAGTLSKSHADFTKRRSNLNMTDRRITDCRVLLEIIKVVAPQRRRLQAQEGMTSALRLQRGCGVPSALSPSRGVYAAGVGSWRRGWTPWSHTGGRTGPPPSRGSGGRASAACTLSGTSYRTSHISTFFQLQQKK